MRSIDLIILKFVEDDAVGLVDFDLLAMHHKQSFFEIYAEEGHRVGLMVQGYKVPVVREQRSILGLLAADRQAEDLVQLPVIRIDPVDRDGIVTRVGADQIFEVR